MNKAKLKTYAPAARREFIRAVTDRANLLGLGDRHSEPMDVSGEVAVIGGRAFPKKVAAQRDGLEARIRREGFNQVMEAVAYTWFNRFAALRYMELHGYLEHGYRVLSHPAGGTLPELLEQAAHVELPGLGRDQIIELTLAGNQDAELYRRLLVAQCNALADAMPFLFERIDDNTELLLPDNLLHSDSLIRKLVDGTDEADWQQVEIIGWLYQFYISEKKDQVIGKVVKSEDIPAATQLFTPNWIVQYLVQNSVGRLWLMANPTSTLAKEWPYYIQPAEQTPEVQAQLDALIQTRIREDGETLNPETITVLDPACGSGHILVVAYDVLKAIYLERGYQPRAIPRLILEKNLYGLDIDDRAAQLAAFALLMKARADDRRLFTDPPKLNLLSLQESKGLDAGELATHLAPFGLQRGPIKALLDTFEHAKTFGSLIQIPAALNGQLAAMTATLQRALQDGDLYARQAAKDVLPLVWQALVLGMQVDAVVANPPYMGSQYQTPEIKNYLKTNFPGTKSDLFSAFIDRCLFFSLRHSHFGFVTPFVWMFLSSYEELREILLSKTSITSLVQLEYNAFEPACIPVCAFAFSKTRIGSIRGSYIKLSEFKGIENQAPRALEAIKDRDCQWRFDQNNDRFQNVPSSIIAYSYPQRALDAFDQFSALATYADLKQGLITGENNRFMRFWHEVDFRSSSIGGKSHDAKWYPYQKGGSYRKWYGNNEYVVNWQDDGREIRNFVDQNGKLRSRPQNIQYFFREGVTWTSLTISSLSMRYVPEGHIFDAKGPMCFPKDNVSLWELLGYANSIVIDMFLKEIAPTMDYSQGPVGSVPFAGGWPNEQVINIQGMVAIARKDWDSYETSWDFSGHPFISQVLVNGAINHAWQEWDKANRENIQRLQRGETKNNAFVVGKFGLQSELIAEVPESQVTLTRADREKDCQRLISYAVGCLMGRYSLDEPGLIYAHAGNVGFDPSRYEKKLPADADGILPITDEHWFADDAASRVREFLRAVWGADTLEENMAWLAESLGSKGSETPDETVRRYLADKFFKDHLQTYKKRPIYWLFSSGKQGAFQALVYLHRYHEGTLARLRAEYVVPLQGKLAARIGNLQDEIAAAPSTAARNKLQKRLDTAKKQQTELIAYDDLLRHYADQRLSLDLDDGVKVNYGKFGNLLAEVKTVTGGSGDD
ncbi:BREX-1 system adenine-specific DNA-methyltransferase PglX [Methyloversatilis sp.]|uniref:BREX-1 system adenine-specific DNA-methyltransferase PglX n=1 Tax=Methyloversatilis sp. TaxID=2569862 RepID=UPI0027374DAA|nr:BREX-1 system adenine-specific DNA-methyltransferase PglX [Methyloversatilis sp.]MDP3457032.1 BREX-1 system adenine-specific DNA-methyltransferase PglX [Methyloversatilis sp.]